MADRQSAHQGHAEGRRAEPKLRSNQAVQPGGPKQVEWHIGQNCSLPCCADQLKEPANAKAVIAVHVRDKKPAET